MSCWRRLGQPAGSKDRYGELRYVRTARLQELLGLVHPAKVGWRGQQIRGDRDGDVGGRRCGCAETADVPWVSTEEKRRGASTKKVKQQAGMRQ